MKPLETILEVTTDARKSGSGWSTKCPAHDDRKASLSITEGADGKVLLFCHAGCDFASIVKAYGLEEGNLFPPKDGEGRRIVAEYSYTDEAGAELFQSVRFEPKDFRQRHREGGEWVWNLNGTRRVLYQLPELLAGVKAGATVLLVEGERDVEAIRTLGLVATCNPMGAGKWRDEYAEALRGARVEIIADKDPAGRKHAASVEASLRGAAASVRVVEVPKGKDAADWIASGATREDFEKLAVEALAALVPDGGEWITLDKVAPERVEWLQLHRIARGKLTLGDGDPGLGKGFAVTSIIAAVTTGSELPGGGSFGPAHVILLSSEDGLADTIRPRLDAAGGDPSRVHVLSFVRHKGEKLFPSLRRDMDIFEKKVQETGAALAVIDPLMGFLGVKDSHKDADVKEALGPFAQMLDRLKLAAIGIRHLNKSQVALSLYRGGGSIGIIGAARSAFLFARDPDDDNRLIVAATKANLCPMPASLAFRIVGTPNGSARAVWEPHTNEHRADALLLSAINTQGAKRAGLEAAEWLGGALKDGPVRSLELEEECKAKGISFKTVREAAKRMGVLVGREKKKKGHGAWWWGMPGSDLLSLPPDKRERETRNTKKASLPSSPSSLIPLFPSSPLPEKGRNPKSAERLDCGSARYTAADLEGA